MTQARERIGLTLPGGAGISKEQQLELVRHAESLGYDSIWIGEAWGPEVFTTLTWLACHTSTIKLAAGIANVFSRTPGLMAQTVATLDAISGGRAILGLGTSGKAVVENWHGIPFEKGAQRLKEYAEIVRLALSGQRVTYDGQVFKLRGFRLNMTPLRPSVPIYFASISPAGFRATGQVADGWLPIWTAAESFPGFIKEIGEAATAAGRSITDIAICADLHGTISSDPGVRDRARAGLSHYIGGMGVYYHQLVSRQGFAQEADAIRDAYARHQQDQAAALVTDEMVDKLTLSGDAQRARARLAQYRQAGVTLPIINCVGSRSPQEVRDTLETLAPRS